ncbi:MAG TPA: FHA domain-containing protein [Kofleriaceae bacterium]|nr:FHA domain-containing protein [Kofleriaceae bacterium]
MIKTSATTSGHSAEWAIDDEVIRLREWATDTVHPLIADDRKLPTIGTAETCSVRVRDSSQRVAGEHARFERSRGRWSIVDGGSEHGLRVDGARCESAELRPGVEISLGGAVTLIAESQRLIALREALSRVLGWSPARQETVDLALRQIRDHDRQQSVLVLCGGRDDHDLVPIAEELHRLTLTEQRPFIVCNPRRSTTATAEDPIRTIADGMTALAEAQDGTLCLLNGKLPRNLTAMLAAMLPPECRTHIVLCAGRAEDVAFQTPPIVVPPLSTRKAEIDRLINEYVLEAAHRLYCAKRIRLSPADRAWLRDSAGESLPEIQKATLRLVAVRDAGSVNAAAALLGISHVALAKWLDKRGFSKLEAASSRKITPARAVTRARRGTSPRASIS